MCWALNATWHAWCSPQAYLQKDETETNIDLHTCQIAKCWGKYLLSPLLSLSLSLYVTKSTEHNEEQKSKEAEFLAPLYTLVGSGITLIAEFLKLNRSRKARHPVPTCIFKHGNNKVKDILFLLFTYGQHCQDIQSPTASQLLMVLKYISFYMKMGYEQREERCNW